MSIEVCVPVLTDTTILSWRKKTGDPVRRGETIVDLETASAILEVPAPDDGVLDRIEANEGDTVQVGDLLAVINVDEVTCTERNKSSHETPTGRETGLFNL